MAAQPETGSSSQDFFQLIVEEVPIAVLMIDAQSRIRVINRRAEELFGYPREELFGQPIGVLVPERVRDQHPTYVAGFLAQPTARAMGVGRDLYGRRRDGSEVPVEIGLSPVQTTAGLCTLASIIDITARKHAQAWARAIVDASPNASLVVDRAGRIVLANPAAETMFGYAREEMLGKNIEMLLPERVRAAHPGFMMAFFADPRARPMGAGRDLYGVRKDGIEVPLEIGLSPVQGPDGVFTLASIIDITERKRAEDEIRRSNAELEQFAYVASHDLQEPLRMVANYTELLAERYGGKLDERADKYIHYATDGARRMQRLVADLLAYARIGSQGRSLQPVDAGAVVASVLQSLQAMVGETGARIEYAGLPTVLGDESQLRALFQNLISNSIKFRSDSPPRITIGAEKQAGCWRFVVTDNGIGIDMQYRERIFQMFQRLHERGRYEGSGIGLAVAKRIVERHGGTIGVESSLGAGATFWFTLAAAPGRPK